MQEWRVFDLRQNTKEEVITSESQRGKALLCSNGRYNGVGWSELEAISITQRQEGWGGVY